MKKNLIIAFCFSGLMACAAFSQAQETNLVADQNPRYAESVNKYGKLTDSLTQFQGTTIQDTYKAYDWYEARLERRRLRSARNDQYSFSLGYNYGNSWYYPSYGYRRNHWFGW